MDFACIDIEVDIVEARPRGQSRHRHDLAAQRVQEAGTNGRTDVLDLNLPIATPRQGGWMECALCHGKINLGRRTVKPVGTPLMLGLVVKLRGVLAMQIGRVV